MIISILIIIASCLMGWMMSGYMLGQPIVPAPLKKALSKAERPESVFDIDKKVYNSLSVPSKELIKLTHSIPADHRPPVNLVDALSALDESCGEIKEINQAFGEYQSFHNEIRGFDWYPEDSTLYMTNKTVVRRKKIRSLYVPIYESLNTIKKALDEQERELKLAGLAPRLADLTLITEHARNEKNLIEGVTKSIKEN